MNLCWMCENKFIFWNECSGWARMVLHVHISNWSNFYDEKQTLCNSCDVIAHVLPRKCTRERHMSTMKLYTCRPRHHTRVDLSIIHVSAGTLAESVQWRGQNHHVCNYICDETHQIITVQQLLRYKGDEQNFVITSSHISFHDAFSVYYDNIRSSQMCTFLVVIHACVMYASCRFEWWNKKLACIGYLVFVFQRFQVVSS